MQPGYAAPFVNCYYNGDQITPIIESFKYSFSEDDDDNCEINIRSDDRNICDQPAYQEGAMWTVIWGFIGGKKSHVRKVYCYEVKPEFDDQNILITISFNEKGISLKQRDAKKVHINASMVTIAHDVAKTHGLNAWLEVFNAKQEPVKLLVVDDFVKGLKKNYADQVAKDSLDKKLFGTTDAEQKDAWEGGNLVSLDRTALRDALTSFSVYAQVAQGNKTDKQLLDELGKKQPGGQFIVDTTDDDMTVKRRNFNQKPVRIYTWANGDGELQAFQPETKARSKDGSSLNMNYDGWDPLNKTYFNGDANVLSEESQETLAKFQKERAALNDKADATVLKNFGVRLEGDLKHDATNVVKIIPTPFTILDKKNALDNTINFFMDPDGKNKSMNDPTIKNPADGLANASNLRNEAELKANPGYFEAFGDPGLEKGMIITVMGVSKKYSGNYYITKIDHNIDGNKSYMVHGDLVRQGHNIRTNPSYVSTDQTGNRLNKKIGDPGGKNKTKTLPIKTNP